jgi:diaminopimelate dehydrogenase
VSAGKPGPRTVRRLRLAVVGFGRVGTACAETILGAPDLELAGVVRPPEEAALPLPDALALAPSVAHISELARVDAALVCVPTEQVLGVAHDLLQHGVPIVECANLEGDALRALWDEIERMAHHHRVAAMVGAGWNSGAVSSLERLFDLLIPKGHTSVTNRPGISLHHTAAAAGIEGVKGALCTELRDASGRQQRYLYLELDGTADLGEVRESILRDPLFLGEETLMFPVERIAELEDAGHGIVIERRGTSGLAAHDTLLFEGRFDAAAFTARIMLDAARQLPGLRPGAHRWSV